MRNPFEFHRILSVAFFLTTSLFAAPLDPKLSALHPVPLLPEANADAHFYDKMKGETPAVFTPITSDASGLAYRFEVPIRGKNSYDVEAKIKTIAAVKKGDVCLARLLARAPVAKQESGEGSIGFTFARGEVPYEKSVSTTLTPGPEWSAYDIPFVVADDFDAGVAIAGFAVADLPQTVEISGLEILNFQNRATLDQLPITLFSYHGREPKAAWRAAALERIEKIRTAPLSISVVDSAGKPVAGAHVEAVLDRADFIWGSAVNDQTLMKNSSESERYRKTFLECFNMAVIENGLKWPTWSSSPERQQTARDAVDWIVAHDLRLKGHNLVWPAWKFSPKNKKTLPDLSTALPEVIHARIAEMVTLTKGRAYAWDVVNEPVHEQDYFAHIPETAMVDWFKQAHELDPDLQLFINEYGMLNSAMSPAMIKRFLTLIQTLRAAGAPIGGIGIEGHIGAQQRGIEQVLSDLDLLAKEGLPLQITEFDVNTKDEQLQADYTRDFLIACYSHPAVTGFIMWGFWEARHWKPQAAMFRKDWSEKPNAAVWREWVLGKWKTHFEAKTSSDGQVSTRGHLGHYSITVSHAGHVKKQKCHLTHEGAVLSIQLP